MKIELTIEEVVALYASLEYANASLMSSGNCAISQYMNTNDDGEPYSNLSQKLFNEIPDEISDEIDDIISDFAG